MGQKEDLSFLPDQKEDLDFLPDQPSKARKGGVERSAYDGVELSPTGPTKAQLDEEAAIRMARKLKEGAHLKEPSNFWGGVGKSLNDTEANFDRVGDALTSIGGLLHGTFIDLPGNLWNSAKTIATAPAHPVQTAENLWEGIKSTPGRISDAAWKSTQDPYAWGREMGNTFVQPAVTAGLSEIIPQVPVGRVGASVAKTVAYPLRKGLLPRYLSGIGVPRFIEEGLKYGGTKLNNYGNGVWNRNYKVPPIPAPYRNPVSIFSQLPAVLPNEKELTSEELTLRELQAGDPLKSQGGFFEGMFDAPRDLFNSVNESSKVAAKDIKTGNYGHAFETMINPLMTPFKTTADMLLNPKYQDPNVVQTEGVNQLLGAAGLPVESFRQALENEDYQRIAGQVAGAGLTFGLGHNIQSRLNGSRPGPLREGPLPEVTSTEGVRAPQRQLNEGFTEGEVIPDDAGPSGPGGGGGDPIDPRNPAVTEPNIIPEGSFLSDDLQTVTIKDPSTVPYWESKGYRVTVTASGKPLQMRKGPGDVWVQPAEKPVVETPPAAETPSTMDPEGQAYDAETLKILKEYLGKITREGRENRRKYRGWQGEPEVETPSETSSFFKKLIEDDSGTFDSGEIWKNLKKLLKRDPTPEEVERAMARQPREGETTGRVAQFPDRMTAEERATDAPEPYPGPYEGVRFSPNATDAELGLESPTTPNNVTQLEPKGLRDSFSTTELQQYLTSPSLTPELRKQIENLLRSRGVMPDPDNAPPVSGRPYEGWNWDKETPDEDPWKMPPEFYSNSEPDTPTRTHPEVLPPETKYDIFGYPTDRDLTPAEVEKIKRGIMARESQFFGPDDVENQEFMDSMTGTINADTVETPKETPKVRTRTQLERIAAIRDVDPNVSEDAKLKKFLDEEDAIPPEMRDLSSYGPEKMNPSKKSDPDEGPQFSRVGKNAPPSLQGGVYDAAVAHMRGETDINTLREYMDITTNAVTYHRTSGDTAELNLYRKLREAVVDRLNTLSADEGPTHARVEGGGYKASMNVRRGVENITKDYTSPLPGIMVREGMQNAMDATEGLGDKGHVKIRINDGNKTIEIHDNGKGMDDATIGSKLFEAFATGKEGEEGATGGKGIGSASYIYGGKKFELESVAVDSHDVVDEDGNVVRKADGKKYRIVTSGSPEQFIVGKNETFSRTRVAPDTPTGTTITVHLKDDHDLYSARTMVERVAEHSRNRSMTIISDKYGHTFGPVKDLGHIEGNGRKIAQSKDDKLIGDFTTTNRNSDVKILLPKFDPSVKRDGYEIHYLNNGMYQFSEVKYVGEEAAGVPPHVLVDIHPNVDDQDELYPFINTREDVKKDIRDEVNEFIKDNITKPAISKKKNRTQELYDSMPNVSLGSSKRRTTIFDPGERLHTKEKDYFTNSKAVKDLAQIYDETFEKILQAIGRDKWSNRLEGVGLVLDPNMHGVHIPNPTTGKSTILLNPFARIGDIQLTPKDAAWKDTGTILHETAHIGTESGMHIPFHPDDLKDPRVGQWLVEYFGELSRHGDTGWSSTGHGMDFAHRLGEVYAKFGIEGRFQTADKLHEIYTGGTKTGGYSPEFQKLLHIYTESRQRPVTKEDLLSGTGIKQANQRPERKRSIFSNSEADRIRTNPPKW